MHGLASLDLFDFGILLQALSNNLKVGVLAVRSGDREKYLHLDRSKIAAVYTRRPKVSIEKVLWNYRAIEKGHIKAAMEAKARLPESGTLAQHLLSAGLVTPQQLRRAHVYQLIEEILELFYWKSVGFEFYAGNNAKDILKDPSLIAVGEPIDVDSILLQATKTIDDIAKFNEVTPSLRDVYELYLGNLGSLEEAVPDPIEREFLLLIDGVRDMREVLRDMRLNRFDALECFYKFRTRGWLRPKNAFELLMLSENRKKDFTPEKRARVLERVNELGVEGFQILLPLAQTYEAMGAGEKAAQLYATHARKCLAGGDSDGAISAATRAKTLLPSDAALREFEIEVLTVTGRMHEAAAAHLALATQRISDGEPAAARRGLRRAVRLSPTDAAAWRALAEVEERLRAPRRAACCRRRQASVHRKEGDAESAIDALQRAHTLCPQAWTIRYRLAELLHAAGRGDQAVQTLADLTTFVVANTAWTGDTQKRRHLERIEQHLRVMGGLASSAAQALGRAWGELGDRARAVAVFRESAETLVRAGRHRGAVQALEELLEIDVNDHDARRALARAHAAAGDGTRALSHLRRLSGYFMSAGRYEEARDAFTEMLQVDGACPDAHRGLARALLYLGSIEAAADHYHRVGLIYRGYGQPEEAAPYLREAVDRRPNDAELLEEYCELLLSMTGRREETLQALAALVDLRMNRGHHARAAIALTRILEIDARYPGAKAILQDAAKQLLRLAETSEEISPEDARRMMEAARATHT
ncbi:MAG: tetratricopeptide repeat protein [Planctomycetes bacterium]|nr:tetratricopeptide repeat protein [Planctomycetota bacterium]